jgi:hypothetical protein
MDKIQVFIIENPIAIIDQIKTRTNQKSHEEIL